MRTISAKLIVLLTLCALIPLCLFGLLSILTSRQATSRTVTAGNLNVARRAADQIQLYVTNAQQILRAIAENINRTHLTPLQQEVIIKNYALNFEEFREIYLTDRAGRQTATSRIDGRLLDRGADPAYRGAIGGHPYRSEVTVTQDLTPTMTIAVPIRRLGETEGVVVGEINLINMWNLVDSIRIGQRGFALVVSRSGLLIAHGEGASKPRLLRQERLSALPIVQAVLAGRESTATYLTPRQTEGRAKPTEVLGVGAPIRELGWGVVIEQPTAEAYDAARQMTLELAVLIGLFLILMVAIGYLGGRWGIVRPIQGLIASTRAIAGGDLSHKVTLSGRDEFSELGAAFNRMTGRLLDLQEEIRRNERSATFGRIAAGLVHDLRHPIRNIENSSRLLQRLYDDADYRQTFQRTVEREFASINRFLDDLHHLTSPTPLKPIELDPHRVVDEVLDLYRQEAGRRRCRIERHLCPGRWPILADRFALERVLKNLVLNALQAMPEGGTLTLRSSVGEGDGEAKGGITLAVADTGIGIPPQRLPTLFVDYATTKHRGLGLGLATCRKLVQEMGGVIEVESEEGRGSEFRLRFPLLTPPSPPPPPAEAAGAVPGLESR